MNKDVLNKLARIESKVELGEVKVDLATSDDINTLNKEVQKAQYNDVLLLKAPFSYSVIKFPWMPKALYVNWPT